MYENKNVRLPGVWAASTAFYSDRKTNSRIAIYIVYFLYIVVSKHKRKCGYYCEINSKANINNSIHSADSRNRLLLASSCG